MIIEKWWKEWLEKRWNKYLEQNSAFVHYHAPFSLCFLRTCMFICCYIEPGTTGLSKKKCDTYLLAQCKQGWWLIKTKQFMLYLHSWSQMWNLPVLYLTLLERSTPEMLLKVNLIAKYYNYAFITLFCILLFTVLLQTQKQYCPDVWKKVRC